MVAVPARDGDTTILRSTKLPPVVEKKGERGLNNDAQVLGGFTIIILRASLLLPAPHELWSLCMSRSRRRLDARKRGGGDEQPPKPSNHSKVTASPRNRPSSSTKRSVPTRSSLSPSSNTRSKRISASPTSGKRRGGSVSANKAPSVLLESESEPSLPCSDPVPATSAAAAAAAAIATDNTANKGSTEALTGGESSSSSYRARQRLSEAKELDREFGVARENGDGGGGGG